MPVGVSKEIMCGPGNTMQSVRFENLTKTNDLAPLNKLLFRATFNPYQLNQFVIKIFLCHHRSANWYWPRPLPARSLCELSAWHRGAALPSEGTAGESNHIPDSHAQFYCATTPQCTAKLTRMTSEVWKAKFLFCISKLCQHKDTQLPP